MVGKGRCEEDKDISVEEVVEVVVFEITFFFINT